MLDQNKIIITFLTFIMVIDHRHLVLFEQHSNHIIILFYMIAIECFKIYQKLIYLNRSTLRAVLTMFG